MSKRNTAYGPYADENGSLTPAGKAFLTEWLAQWVPVALFKKAYRGTCLRAETTLGTEEVEQLCLLAVVKSVTTFDPSRKVKFQTYAAHGMRNTVSDAIRRASKAYERGVFVTNEIEEWDAIHNTRVTDRIDDTANIREVIERQLVRARVSPRDREILRMRYGIGQPDELTWEKCGKRFGITKERARQIVFRAIEKIRGEINI